MAHHHPHPSVIHSGTTDYVNCTPSSSSSNVIHTPLPSSASQAAAAASSSNQVWSLTQSYTLCFFTNYRGPLHPKQCDTCRSQAVIVEVTHGSRLKSVKGSEPLRKPFIGNKGKEQRPSLLFAPWLCQLIFTHGWWAETCFLQTGSEVDNRWHSIESRDQIRGRGRWANLCPRSLLGEYTAYFFCHLLPSNLISKLIALYPLFVKKTL